MQPSFSSRRTIQSRIPFGQSDLSKAEFLELLASAIQKEFKRGNVEVQQDTIKLTVSSVEVLVDVDSSPNSMLAVYRIDGSQAIVREVRRSMLFAAIVLFFLLTTGYNSPGELIGTAVLLSVFTMTGVVWSLLSGNKWVKRGLDQGVRKATRAASSTRKQ